MTLEAIRVSNLQECQVRIFTPLDPRWKRLPLVIRPGFSCDIGRENTDWSRSTDCLGALLTNAATTYDETTGQQEDVLLTLYQQNVFHYIGDLTTECASRKTGTGGDPRFEVSEDIFEPFPSKHDRSWPALSQQLVSPVLVSNIARGMRENGSLRFPL